MEALAIAAVALVGLWCLVVLPAVALSGRLSELERQGEVDAALCRLTMRDGDAPASPSTNASQHEYANAERNTDGGGGEQ